MRFQSLFAISLLPFTSLLGQTPIAKPGPLAEGKKLVDFDFSKLKIRYQSPVSPT